jgi:hypothetical protein
LIAAAAFKSIFLVGVNFTFLFSSASLLGLLMLSGIIAAAISSYYLFRWSFSLAQRNMLWIFGLYMLIPMILALYWQ